MFSYNTLLYPIQKLLTSLCFVDSLLKLKSEVSWRGNGYANLSIVFKDENVIE